MFKTSAHRLRYCDYPLPALVSASLPLTLTLWAVSLCVRVCVRGMRVVARGVETHRRTLLGRGTGAVKGSSFLDPCDSIFYFPIFLYFLLCSRIVAFAKLCPVYFSISAQRIFQFSAHRTHCVAQKKKVFVWQLSSCEICGPPDDFCLAFLWS